MNNSPLISYQHFLFKKTNTNVRKHIKTLLLSNTRILFFSIESCRISLLYKGLSTDRFSQLLEITINNYKVLGEIDHRLCLDTLFALSFYKKKDIT